VSGSPRDSSAGSSGDAAIVTGGGSGLGRAIARRLATAGTRVAVLARTEDQLAETVALIEGAGGEAVAVRADVSDPATVERGVQTVEQQLRTKGQVLHSRTAHACAVCKT